MGVNFSGFTRYQKLKDNTALSNRTLKSEIPKWVLESHEKPGSWVYHAVFGAGTIVSATATVSEIRFRCGVKKILPGFYCSEPITPSQAQSDGLNEKWE